MIKVLFVTRGWPTKRNPMSGNYESVQAKALVKKGIEVTVINVERRSFVHLLDKRVISKFEEDGVTVLSIKTPLFATPTNFYQQCNRLNLWLRQRAFSHVYDFYRNSKGDADVIHAHFVERAYDCKKVLDTYHIPLIITEHWSLLNYDVVNKTVYNLSNGYNWADKVICVSRQLSESLRKKFGVDSIVIHNMVSDDFYLGKVHKNLSNTVRFISIGALLERKGFDILINAFAKSEKLSQCSLCIIGSGKEETKLSKLIEQNSLQNKVFLLGRKLPNEVNKLISDSDCFILTSRRETFGIVYIEAMAKGKPVIATICGGPESFVNDSNGILIPTEDVEAATKAIDYMVENVDKYDNAAIRQYCHDNFSEEAISQKIITVYKEVLKQRNK